MRIQLVLLGLLTAAATAACGSTTTSTPAASGAASGGASSSSSSSGSGSGGAVEHLCTVFPKPDAERILGMSLQNGTDGKHECTYEKVDPTEHLASVTVNLESGADQPHQYDFDRSHPIGNEVLVDVSGVGDKAYWSAGARELVAIKGNNLIHVFILESSVSDPQAADVQIAQLVFRNLG